MDLIKEANKIVNDRDSVYPPISSRSLGYICSGIEIKLDRAKDVINKIRNVNTTAYLTAGDIDSLIDLCAYVTEIGNRIEETIPRK